MNALATSFGSTSINPPTSIPRGTTGVSMVSNEAWPCLGPNDSVALQPVVAVVLVGVMMIVGAGGGEGGEQGKEGDERGGAHDAGVIK
jgi:hypothetical protein